MSKRLVVSIFAVLMVVVLLVGCSSSEEDKNSIENLDKITEESQNKEDTTPVETPEPVVTPEPEPEPEADKIVTDDGKLRGKLTGEIVTEEAYDRRPIAVMLDNHYKARPQASLGDADVIYEILAEGRITRYMAIIQSKAPSWIGPVRSARPYYIDKALEYDPYYVHVGGSEAAKDEIKQLQMADIDGMAASAKAMWRENHKYMPHNMYSSMAGVTYEATRKNYRTEAKYDGFSFNLNGTDLEGEALTKIRFPYKSPSSSDSVGYTSEFRYDEENNQYLRYINNEAYKDEKTKEQLVANNIIVQFAKHRIIDDYGRRAVDLIGQGRGYYITRGNYVEITWSKADRHAATKFYDTEGNEILFNVGVTWIQVVPDDMKLKIN